MRIKLLNLPEYHHMSVVRHCYETQYPSVPSALPVLAGLLRERGFKVDQDDLNVKLFHVNINRRGKSISLAALTDEQRIATYTEGKGDSGLEKLGERILGLTASKGFDIVVFSAPDWNVGGTLSEAFLQVLAGVLKRQHNPYIVVGGRIPDDCSHRLIEREIVDFSFMNGLLYPGHSNLPALCEHLEAGNVSLDIPGLTYRCKGVVHSSPAKREKEPFITPDFDGLPLDMYRRNIPIEAGGRGLKDDILVLPFNFIRGCQFNCAFCSQSYEQGWYAREPEEVATAISELSRRYRTKYFFFLNSSVNPTKEYAMRLCDALIEQGADVLWTDCANFHHADAELIRRLSEAGAARLVFGMESASPRLLKFIRKPLDIRHAERMLRETSKHRIWTELDFIAGLPTEDEEDLNLTLEFLRRNQKYFETCDLFKFWLEGQFLEHPGLFGLKIIEQGGRKMAIPSKELESHKSSGDGWESAERKIEASFERIQKGCVGKRRPDDSFDTFPFKSDDHLRFIHHLTMYTYK